MAIADLVAPHGADSIIIQCSYLSWDDYFIALAFLSSQRSKDPNKQVHSQLLHTLFSLQRLLYCCTAYSQCCFAHIGRAVCGVLQQASSAVWRQVGAVIVSAENIILGIGYNGFPRGCADSQLPWAKRAVDGDILQTKYPYGAQPWRVTSLWTSPSIMQAWQAARTAVVTLTVGVCTQSCTPR